MGGGKKVEVEVEVCSIRHCYSGLSLKTERREEGVLADRNGGGNLCERYIQESPLSATYIHTSLQSYGTSKATLPTKGVAFIFLQDAYVQV